MEKFILSPEKKTVFIMGAGASKDDNIPVQNEILDKIIKGDFAYRQKKNQSGVKEYDRISRQIKQLVTRAFGSSAGAGISLESLFNTLENALNLRENIGSIELREIRAYYRDLIQGIMYATRTEADADLHNVKKHLGSGEADVKSPYTEMGVQIYKHYASQNAGFSFINFNYDICLDRVLLSMYDKNPDKSFDLDYGINLGNYILNAGHKFSFGRPRQRRMFLLRPHGSVNWLFCRSCGQVFSKLTRQNRAIDIREGTKCYLCKLSNLEPYIVYPSYNRIYENKHLVKIWMNLEEVLADADKWCFIGYSLPEADKYFTYVLTRIYNYRKAVKSAAKPLPEISVVNINKASKKQHDMINALKSCGSKSKQVCSAVSEAENYFAEVMKDKDIFKKFEIYFDGVIKYECSFKEFTNKYFSVS